MPKTKMFISLIVIVLAVALLGGATMAWFTDSTDPIENVFTAGTLEIEAGDKTQIPNWNPGDGDEVEFCVTNTGTKNARVRLNLEDSLWNPGPYRVLVLVSEDSNGNKDLQLIGVEWPTFCQGCTGNEGPMATGSASYSTTSQGSVPVKLSKDYYWRVQFSNLNSDQEWLENYSVDSKEYFGWCLDRARTISSNTMYSVEVYDPHCNPNWYNQVDLPNDDTYNNMRARWASIDFNKLSYIINHDFLSRGYISTEIQQAIWYYTNYGWKNEEDVLEYGPNDSRYYFGNSQDIVDYIDGIAENFGGDIIAALNSIPNVTWEIISGNWTEEDGYIYYDDILEPGQQACFTVKIKLSGPLTSNIYQGMDYKAAGFFEAVQESNFAPYYEWGTNLYGEPPSE